MSDLNKAVFLSYASQDAESAKRICDALRQAGVEVWFDRSELRGGDAWDQKIRKQIKECALFVPLISATTNARPEGYFRLEWKLAVDRSHLLAEDHPFLFPIAVGDINDATARVPERFREVQWTRLRMEETPAELARRVSLLLSGGLPEATNPLLDERARVGAPAKKKKVDDRPAWLRRAWQIVGLVCAVYYLLIGPIWRRAHPKPEKRAVEDVAEAAEAIAAAQKISEAVGDNHTKPVSELAEKSVAVLAFANLSDDKGNEYFSDGISEELLNVLAKIPGLKVSARTSAFYFKGRQVPVPEIARQLGVAYVVEGSVRKAGNQVRITAQLIKAGDGFHVWSDTFTRDLKDVFAVQDEIAGIIARNLELKIGTPAPALAINPEAFDLYLQGRQAWNLRTAEGFDRAEALLKRSLQVAPGFARAHAGLADVWMIRSITAGIIGNFGQRAAPEISQITHEIQQALALDPDSSEAHASLGFARLMEWDPAEAERELRRSIALNPNYATAHHWLSEVLDLSSPDDSMTEIKRAAELDPFSHRILENYGFCLERAGQSEAALAAYDRAIALQPGAVRALSGKAALLIAMGRREEGLAVAEKLTAEDRILVLAATGQKAETETAVVEARGLWRFQLLTSLGRFNEALDELKAEEVRILDVIDWLSDPRLDRFRQDPRLVKLLATLNLTEASVRIQRWRAAHPAIAAAKP